MKKYIVIIAIIIASMATAFGQTENDSIVGYSVSNIIDQVVYEGKGSWNLPNPCLISQLKERGITIETVGVYKLTEYSASGKDCTRRIRIIDNLTDDEISEREAINNISNTLNMIGNEMSYYSEHGKRAHYENGKYRSYELKDLEYYDSSFEFGEYFFTDVEDTLSYTESQYKRMYCEFVDYGESTALMNALNNKKGCNSNITYTVGRKKVDGDYMVCVTVTFKDKKAEYMAERQKRINSIK